MCTFYFLFNLCSACGILNRICFKISYSVSHFFSVCSQHTWNRLHLNTIRFYFRCQRAFSEMLQENWTLSKAEIWEPAALTSPAPTQSSSPTKTEAASWDMAHEQKTLATEFQSIYYQGNLNLYHCHWLYSKNSFKVQEVKRKSKYTSEQCRQEEADTEKCKHSVCQQRVNVQVMTGRIKANQKIYPPFSWKGHFLKSKFHWWALN